MPVSSIHLSMDFEDPIVVDYLAEFDDEDERTSKALEAIKVGVIAIQSASPTLDTRVVQEKFAEVEREIEEKLAQYFKDRVGMVPRALDGIFGEKGMLAQTLAGYFDPQNGKLLRLIEAQVGPSSKFGRAIDPKNKEGVIALIEEKVRELVAAKMDEVLGEFSLDDDESAIARLKNIQTEFFIELKEALGVKEGRAEEAERGHVKGFQFEEALYQRIAEFGRDLGDDTEMVRGTAGALGRKTGDYVVTLGETTGAAGLKIAIETKKQAYKLKDAIEELQEAKKNREAICGIFVFAQGCEPAEVGDYRRIGEDFYCTVDEECLRAGDPSLFVEAAYKIARAQAVAVVRKDAAGERDLQRIQEHIDAISSWVDRMGEIATKASTVKKHGDSIETLVKEMRQDLEERIAAIMELLR
jgi:hypothetical protein